MWYVPKSMVSSFTKASVSTPLVPLYTQSSLQGSLKNPSSPTPMRCHGSKPLIYALISFTHSVTKAGAQFGPLGRFRTPSAPQRGSLVTSQPNTAEEFLYRVTTAFTYSLKAVLIFGTLKNCVHPAGVNALYHGTKRTGIRTSSWYWPPRLTVYMSILNTRSSGFNRT